MITILLWPVSKLAIMIFYNMTWSISIQWFRNMIIRWQSDPVNTKESTHSVCDHTNRRTVQKGEDIKELSIFLKNMNCVNYAWPRWHHKDNCFYVCIMQAFMTEFFFSLSCPTIYVWDILMGPRSMCQKQPLYD